MSKIFKNMIPYWKSILVILVLLFVQAWCDLSLPSYTSDIIDVGIQNSGVEHVTPKRITEEEFQTAEFIMTDDEVDLWESLYMKKDGYYERNKASEKELDEADDTLTVALLMNYQMGAMEEDTFKQLMAQQTGQDASVFENMTIEQIGEMMHVKLKSFQQEKEDDDGNKIHHLPPSLLWLNLSAIIANSLLRSCLVTQTNIKSAGTTRAIANTTATSPRSESPTYRWMTLTIT